MDRETSELPNTSKGSRKFSEIFGNSSIIFGHSDTPQDKNLTLLTQKKLAGITLLQPTKLGEMCDRKLNFVQLIRRTKTW